jgi:hypothetical protein
MSACPYCGEHLTKPGAAVLNAMDWLGDALPQEGWHLRAPILAEGKRQGHSQRTLERAARELGIEHRRLRQAAAPTEWRHQPLDDEQPDTRSAVIHRNPA